MLLITKRMCNLSRTLVRFGCNPDDSALGSRNYKDLPEGLCRVPASGFAKATKGRLKPSPERTLHFIASRLRETPGLAPVRSPAVPVRTFSG